MNIGCSLLFISLQVDPVRGDVAFTSAQSGWSFTLQSFAQLYADVFGVPLDTAEFGRRLWGDVYFHPDSEQHCVVHPYCRGNPLH